MIHSMSGGVLPGFEVYTFAKVELADGRRWYLAPFAVEEGDRVLAPVGEGMEEGVVLRTERCTQQTAPIPLRRALPLEKKL